MASQYADRLNNPRYATPRPKYAGRIIGFAAMAALLASFYGFRFAQFLPSPLGSRIGEGAGVILTVIGAFFALRWKPVSDRPVKWTMQPFIQVPFIALVGFALGYSAFGIGLPSLYSAVWGVPMSRQGVVIGWSYSLHHCPGPLLAGAPLLLAHPCMWREVPRGSIVTLQGRQSVLGFAVRTISVRNPS